MTTPRNRNFAPLTAVLLIGTALSAQAQAPSSLSGRIPRRFALGTDSILESVKPDLGPGYIPGSSYGVSGDGRQVPGLQAITRTNHGNDTSFDAKDSYANPDLLAGAPVASKGDSQSPFNHRIPIVVPPGINGVQPDLALVYSPNAGNGIVGVGWQLDGLSVITRINYGNGINYDGADTYSHSDLGVLRPQSDGTYRTKKESFAKFVRSSETCGDGPCSWTVYQRNGRRYEYGLTNNSRLRRQPGTDSGPVRTWALEKVVDPFENSYSVRYESYVDTGGTLLRQGGGALGRLYPDVITYTNRPDSESQPTKRTVEFTYQRRTDQEPGYYQNASQRTVGRLQQITVKTGVTGATPNGIQVRAYRLFYGHSPSNGQGVLSDAPVYGPSTGRSRLTAVQEYGGNNGVLPAQTFEWQDGGTAFTAQSLTISGLEMGPSGPYETPPVVVGDFDGDGRTDIAYGYQEVGNDEGQTAYRGVCFLPSTGSGFGTPRCTELSLTGMPEGTIWNIKTIRTGDFDGDGRTDIALTRSVQTNSESTYYVIDVFLTTSSGVGSTPSASLAIDDPNYVWMGDFDGDGKTDIARIQSGVLGVPGSGPGMPIQPNPLAIHIADFNGDGRSDLAVIYSGNQIYLSNGKSFDASQVPNYGSIVPLIGDFNGDGKADLAFKGTDTKLYVYLSTGSSFEALSAMTLSHPYSTLMVGDFNGDGKDDIASWGGLSGSGLTLEYYLSTGNGFSMVATTISQTAATSNPLLIGDFAGQNRKDIAVSYDNLGNLTVTANVPASLVPDLMTAVHNGRGGSVIADYRPAAQVSNAIVPGSTNPGIPNTHPRILVTKVTTYDGRGGSYWTDYQPVDGRIRPGTIPVSRDLGFATFDAVDGRTQQRTRTIYSQTAPFERLAQETAVCTGSCTQANLVSDTTRTFVSCPAASICALAIPGNDTELVRESRTYVSDWEAGIHEYNHQVDYTYGEYAFLLDALRSDDGRPAVRVHFTPYGANTTLWLLDRASEVKVTEEATGATLKWLKSIGWSDAKVTSKTEWLDTPGADLITTFPSYDGFGHLLQVKEPGTAADGIARVTNFEYDNTYHANLTRIVNALSQETKAEYNDDGSIKWVQDANGPATRTTYTYDEFGRKQAELRPDGGRSEYYYLLTGRAGPVPGDSNNPTSSDLYNRTIIHLDDQRTLAKYEYFDGTGFVYWVTTVGECASGATCTGIPQEGQVSVQHLKDSAGRPWKTSFPYYPTETMRWTTTEYDARSRVSRVTTPDTPTNMVTNFSYGFDSAAGAFASATDPNGKVTRTYVNARKSVSKVVAALGTSLQQETTYGYDALERPISMTPPGQQAMTFTYDSLGRRRTFIDPQLANRTVTFSYDALNRVKSQQMAGGDAVALDYDESSVTNGIGRLTKVTDKSGVTHFGYTTMGQLSSVLKEAESGETLSQTYQYNYAGQVKNVVYPDPDHSSIDYTYTIGGNLWQAMLGGANVATWSNYTATGKPQNVGYANTVTTTYSYDAVDHLASVNTLGTAGVVLQNLTYDWYSLPNTGGINIGKITDNRTNKIAGDGANTDETQTYTYDDLYRLTLADNIGSMANRAMTFDGQLLTSITSNGTTGQVSHDGFGNMTHRELEGTTLNYDWTKENFLWKVSKNDGSAVEMFYDAWGQRAKKIFTGAGSTVTTLYLGKTYEKRTFGDGGLAQHTIYIYANGQVIAQVTKHGSSATAFNSPNRWRGELAAASLYNGHNLKGAIQKVYHYLNAAALHPQSARWVILAFFLLFNIGVLAALVASKLGKTVKRSSYSPALRWASLSVLMLFIFSACGGGGPGGGGLYSVANYVVSDNTLRGPIEGTLFYHRNHINSTSIVTKSDGTEYSRHLYVPYGEMAKDRSSGGDAVTRKFTGQERDEETGLDYFNARYYDPAIGRFISADTIIPEVLNGQAFNRYAYGLGNPITHDDPTGHFFPVVAALLAAWACVEFALSVYDAVTTAETIADPNASPSEKTAALAGFALGMVAPGGGYGKVGKEVAKEMTERALREAVEKAVQRGLNQSEKSAISKIGNAIRDHLTPEDIAGAIADKKGTPIAKPGGGFWDHLKEMEETLRGLRNNAEKLKNSMHPDATKAREQALKAIKETEEAIDRALQ